MKVHLAVSDAPISEGSLCSAICDKSVPKTRIHFMWDAGIIPDLSRNLIGMCKDCREAEIPEGRYVYGISSGQEARDQA